MKKIRTKDKLCILGFFVLALIFIILLAEKLVPYDPYAQDLSQALLPPSMVHWFGTDRYGRDMFSRVLVGGQTSLFSALFLVVIISCVGTILGILSGYFGGILDTVLMRISDVFLAFPGMVFAIAVASVLSGGVWNAVIALACISWPKYARLARSQVLSVKRMPYIMAAKLSGTSSVKMMTKHIFPNISGPLFVTAVLDIGTMIMEIAGLSFLGLGATPPIAEWGSMMSEGRSMLQLYPWLILAPGLAIFVTVIIFNLFGDTLRDYMDPRNRYGI